MEFIESAPKLAQPGEADRYGVAVLCASLNPEVQVLSQPAKEATGVPAELAGGQDAAGFLARFYLSQRT